MWVALYLFLINVHLAMPPHTLAWSSPSFFQLLDHVVNLKDVIHAKRVGVSKELFSNGHKVPTNLWICGILYFFPQQIACMSAGRQMLPPSMTGSFLSHWEWFWGSYLFQRSVWEHNYHIKRRSGHNQHSWYYTCLHCPQSVVSYQ